MPDWLLMILLLVFIVHLLVFGRLAISRQQKYYWLVSAVFAALVASFGLRLTAPDWMLGPVAAYRLFRYLAWLLAVVTLPWLAVRLWTRSRRNS